MRTVLLVLIGLIVSISTVLVWNSESCKAHASQQTVARAATLPVFDQELLAQQLAQAIRIVTVSDTNKSEAFSAFHHLLQQQFPLLHQQLQRQVINQHSLLYRWPGSTIADKTSADKNTGAVLLMAHMDVVPANAADWQQPPFAGVIDAKSVWGRGALDDKSSLITMLHAAEVLLAEGFQPQHDIYFAFGHDEEIGGQQGAAQIAKFFTDDIDDSLDDGPDDKAKRFAAVVDEGGVIAKGFLPGLERPFAAIGPGEKGYLSIKLLARGESGHSSMPAADSAINRLNRALQRINANPFPANYAMIKDMIHAIAGALPFGKRLILCNDWLFESVIIGQLEKTPALNASMRTTVAITKLNAGFKDNVIPGRAEAVINLRLLPGDSIETAVAYLQRIVNDEQIELSVLPGAKTSSAVTDVSGKAYQWLAKTLQMTYAQSNLLIAPRIVTAATDSSHFAELSDNILRFAPFTITPATLKGVHGNDEHIEKQELVHATAFYYQLLKNTNAML